MKHKEILEDKSKLCFIPHWQSTMSCALDTCIYIHKYIVYVQRLFIAKSLEIFVSPSILCYAIGKQYVNKIV